jgi:rod shape-determining protein MreC
VLGTLDRTPPPFFRQGYSALTKLIFFAALALFLMVADRRVKLIEPIRSAIATALNPAQQALLVPVSAARDSGEYLRGLHQAKQSEEAARSALAAQALKASQADKLTEENKRLRELLALRPTLAVRTFAADVLYEAGDPYSRKVFIDRGTTQGVVTGSPVMTELGVVGQVIDKNAAIPVINTRTQQRFAAYGGANDDTPMELRFVSTGADVKEGDKLETSGLDGIYPPGLPVATVMSVQRNAAGGFTSVGLRPEATLSRVQHVLVLEPIGAQLPARPEPEPDNLPTRAKKKSAKEAAAAAAAASAAAASSPAASASSPNQPGASTR